MNVLDARRARLAPWVFALALFAANATLPSCSCDDSKGDIRAGTDGVLEANPGILSFSAATLGQPETLQVELRNVGTGPLTAFTFAIEPAGSPFSFIDPQIGELAAGGAAMVDVTYAPDDANPDDANLLVTASNGQSATVRLTSVLPIRQLQCEPEPIQFGPVEIGTSKTVRVGVRNIGNLPVTIEALGLEFGDEVEITDAPNLSLELGPDEVTEVEFFYEAESGGTLEDTLRIAIAEESTVFECRITGTTSLPVIDVPLQIDFGFVELGTTETRTLPVRNGGDFPLTLSQVAFGPESDEDAFDLVGAPFDAIEVPVGTIHQFEVTYTAADRTSNGTVVIASNDPNNPSVPVALLGRPSQPDIAASPEAIDFGSVRMEERRTVALTIFNNGNLPLTVASLALAGDADFAVEPDPEFSPTTGGEAAVIDAFSSHVLTLSLTPTSEGNKAGVLEIASDDPDSPTLSVDLAGTGLQGGTCHVSILPDPVAFGLVVRGQEKIIPVTITNDGTGECRYMGASAEGFLNTAYSVVGSSRVQGDPLAPGESMTVDVLYFPTQEQVNNGTFSVQIEDVLLPPGNVVYCNTGEFCQEFPLDVRCAFSPPACAVDLQGDSAPSQIAVVPGEIDFGLVTVGCASQAATLNVYNIGAGTVSMSDVRLEGCGDEAELRGVPAAFPADIASDSPLMLQVVYLPSDLGVDTCEVVITTETPFGEIEERVPVTGEGTDLIGQVDTFEQVSGRKVDVLFVLDVSGSMDQELRKVADELSTFMATAALLENDFQIGVTHLGWQDRIFYGGRLNEAGELMGEPPYLTPTTPNMQSRFESKVEIGDLAGGTPEAGLVSTMRAFTEPYVTTEGSTCLSDADCNGSFSHCSPEGLCGGRNAGFLRDDASLEVVIVSDEEDQSPSTPDFYLDSFQSIKGFRNDSLLHISVIVGANPDPAVAPIDDMSEVVPCSENNSSAQEGRRYAAVAFATGGSVGSICSPNFGPFLAEVGSRAFGLRREFILSRAADDTTIEVRVNGELVDPNNWVFDDVTNSVIFDDLAVPEPDDTIEVTYDARCFN